MADISVNQKPTLELITISEVARRLDVPDKTLRRALSKAGIAGEAVLVEGKLRSPLFFPSRLPQLRTLIKGKENNES